MKYTAWFLPAVGLWYGFSIPVVSYHRFSLFLETHTAPLIDRGLDIIFWPGKANLCQTGRGKKKMTSKYSNEFCKLVRI